MSFLFLGQNQQEQFFQQKLYCNREMEGKAGGERVRGARGNGGAQGNAGALGKVHQSCGDGGSKEKSGKKPGGISGGLFGGKLLLLLLLLLLLSSLMFPPHLKRSNLV